MKKGIIIGVTILVVGTLSIVLLAPKSVVEASFSNLSEKNEIEAKAPWLPFRSGAIYVFAEGEVTGKGILHIYSNRRRDHQIHTFENQTFSVQMSEPEAWVDDLQVEWEPIVVLNGDMDLFIGCGDGQDELQSWKQNRKEV
ncbi:hypothetical protein [Pelagicoccus sp. SDUM812002]|uniref:hypothetical protein n=1 Tax=Pelagicoccus sp. SDUM812002 TaxID=3041266 RepID=UPI00281030D2|nr:hypothetical protein [Pelagicoccus sp. SDUM812002]MDQ8188530.1 hypothetical protein [Pelagicoccus sp. SDUM812002]